MSPREHGERKFYGIYRGTVLQNVDPEFRGRLLLSCPDVQSLLPSTWAEACAPLSGPPGPGMGAYMVPPIGAGVWVQFERGDPNRPIWIGGRFATPADPPMMAKLGLPLSPSIVFSTLGQNNVVISDMPPTPLTGGIMLRSATGAMIIVNDSGIYISNGKGAMITMIGPIININNGALVIV